MGQLLCSTRFHNFCEALLKKPETAQKAISVLCEQIPEIAEELPIGKLEVQMIAPKTLLDRKDHHYHYEVYTAPEGFQQNETYHETFTVPGKAEAIVTFYAPTGHCWTEDEKTAFRVLALQLCTYFERARMIQLLNRVEITDILTGTVNTRGFIQEGEKRFERGTLTTYACLFINIKNFNYINQLLGPRQGDVVLRKYAHLVQEDLTSDEVLSRLGGDNFTALIRKDRMHDFLQFMSCIRITVPYLESTKTFDIRARIGICEIEEGQKIGEVMNSTTAAMSIAKNSGQGDYIWFKPQMLANSLHDKEISLMFPKALENREFVVYYQPKVTLADNRLCGCEALVRWFRDGKLVPPMEFIPVLEKEGSICRLDFYVLETVCQDIQRWFSKGIQPVCVSVNFSKVHLHNDHLAEDIIAVLQKYHIDSKYIEVELTEMSGYENYETLSQFVQKMRESGVRTSIDDFGTGYSSLNLLKDLNVDIIKLDKSFLNNMENRGENDLIVIRNIVNMVNELNMEVIAEGVETETQADFLRNISCCMAQGFLFDRPLPHDDFEKRLEDGHVYSFAN